PRTRTLLPKHYAGIRSPPKAASSPPWTPSHGPIAAANGARRPMPAKPRLGSAAPRRRDARSRAADRAPSRRSADANQPQAKEHSDRRLRSASDDRSDLHAVRDGLRAERR